MRHDDLLPLQVRKHSRRRDRQTLALLGVLAGVVKVIIRLLLLFAGHALCDYPLQGDFLARGKNHKSQIPGIPFYHCLLAHALIHAGMVFLITRSIEFALAELVIHTITDWAKCDGRINFDQDQLVHYACKVLWAVL